MLNLTQLGVFIDRQVRIQQIKKSAENQSEMQNVIIIRAILLLPIKIEDQNQEKYFYRSDIKEWSQVLI